jgi:hypothetical protein
MLRGVPSATSHCAATSLRSSSSDARRPMFSRAISSRGRSVPDGTAAAVIHCVTAARSWGFIGYLGWAA